jgi:hypothetical protein
MCRPSIALIDVRKEDQTFTYIIDAEQGVAPATEPDLDLRASKVRARAPEPE